MTLPPSPGSTRYGYHCETFSRFSNSPITYAIENAVHEKKVTSQGDYADTDHHGDLLDTTALGIAGEALRGLRLSISGGMGLFSRTSVYHCYTVQALTQPAGAAQTSQMPCSTSTANIRQVAGGKGESVVVQEQPSPS